MNKSFLQQKFYGEPTKENLDKFIKALQYNADQGKITQREANHIIKKAKEYYNES